MKIKDMEELILTLKRFKDEETIDSESKRYVNVVMRMIDNTIENVKNYRNEEEL